MLERPSSGETNSLSQEFYFIRVLPKDGVVDAKSLVQYAIELLEEKDPRLLSVSENIVQRIVSTVS